MSLVNICAVETMITSKRIEVEKRTANNFPYGVSTLVVQEYRWNYYRDVFGSTDICSFNCWVISIPIKTFKYQHPVYGKLRLIEPRITLKLLKKNNKYNRVEVWAA